MRTKSSVPQENTVEGDSVTFSDIATLAGLDYRRIPSARNEIFDEIKLGPPLTLAGVNEVPNFARGLPGVANLDYDEDGNLDIYITNGPGAANSLYSNQLEEISQLTFVDVAEVAGIAATDQDSTSVSHSDIDNNSDHDLLVLGAGEANRLFENLGDSTFVDITEASGISKDNQYSNSASIGDINRDGWLDIVVANSFD
ncbi:MAG: VCBS repeat-containing protein [Hormoscilla sp. GUM202]|nr:VCBS repeat-containing protein [Hormoscilla sp. GUM202]